MRVNLGERSGRGWQVALLQHSCRLTHRFLLHVGLHAIADEGRENGGWTRAKAFSVAVIGSGIELAATA